MNKGTFGFPQIFRDESFHGFPKKKVSGESFFGFPSGRDDFDIKYYNSSTNQTRSIALAGSGTIVIDWGDGSTQLVSLGGLSAYNHNYTQSGYYNVLILGDTLNITQFVITTGGVYSVRRDFSRFKNLTYLRIDRTDLATIPCEIPDISQLNVLEKVILGNSGYYGTFPSFTTNKLITVDFNGSKLTGSIESLGLSLGLTTVNIYSNNLTSGFDVLATLTNLVTLNANNNQFAGILPSFSNSPLLITFQIQINQFSGTLPSFSTNTALVTFNCSDNQFSGTLPSFDGLTSLVTFSCGNNPFSGNIPSFSGCTSIKVISANNCTNLGGVVPYFPTSLRNIELRSSSVNNPLIFPVDWALSLVDLEVFWLYGAYIGGSKTLPDFSNCVILKVLMLDGTASSGQNFNNGELKLNSNVFGATPTYGPFGTERGLDCSPAVTHNIIFSPLPNFKTTTGANASGNRIRFQNGNYGNIIYNLGTKIVYTHIFLANNAMSQMNVDINISDLFAGRLNFNLTFAHILYIAGSNAAPSGTYQQPSGFTHDLTEGQIDALSTTWSVKEKIWILVNCQVSSSNTTKRYKWTITTN